MDAFVIIQILSLAGFCWLCPYLVRALLRPVKEASIEIIRAGMLAAVILICSGIAARCWHSWLRSNKIKCGVNPPQVNSQSTFIQLTPHFTVLDIWRGFATDQFNPGHYRTQMDELKTAVYISYASGEFDPYIMPYKYYAL